MSLALLLSVRFPPHVLGPHESVRAIHGSVAYAVATGWLHGARTVLAVPTVAATLAGLATHRMVFGINTLLVLVMVRHSDTQSVAGLGTAALFLGAGGIGAVPGDGDHPERRRSVGPLPHRQRALLLAALIQLGGAGLQLPMMVLCGFLLGAAGQVVKLCADTAMQIDVDDALRGHVFAVQDALFWISFVVAITAAAAVIPADGRSPGLVAGRVGGLPGRAGGACRRRPRAPKRRAKVAGMATAVPIVADLRAESDELDALVAELPADAVGRAHPGAGLDHRTPDRPSAVDRPCRADRPSPTKPAFTEASRGRGRRPRADSSTGAPRISSPPRRPPSCWPTGGAPGGNCTTRC